MTSIIHGHSTSNPTPSYRMGEESDLIDLHMAESRLAFIQGILEKTPCEDPDAVRNLWKERIWQAIDLGGTARNGVYTGVQFAQIAGAAGAGATGLGLAITALYLIGGPLLVISFFRDNGREAVQDLKAAFESNDKEWQALSLANAVTQLGYGSFGVGFIGESVGQIVSAAGVHEAGSVADAFGIGMGYACIVRGAFMLGRSGYKLHQINQFDTDFYKNIREGSIKEFLYSEIEKGKEHLQRRIGSKGYEALQKWNGVDKPKFEVLKEIDKGIYKEAFMQKLTLFIAVLMIVGGVLAVVYSGGLPLAIMGLLFFAMEFSYLIFDTSSIFNKIVDLCYAKSSRLQELQAAYIAGGGDLNDCEDNVEAIRTEALSPEKREDESEAITEPDCMARKHKEELENLTRKMVRELNLKPLIPTFSSSASTKSDIDEPKDKEAEQVVEIGRSEDVSAEKRKKEEELRLYFEKGLDLLAAATSEHVYAFG